MPDDWTIGGFLREIVDFHMRLALYTAAHHCLPEQDGVTATDRMDLAHTALHVAGAGCQAVTQMLFLVDALVSPSGPVSDADLARVREQLDAGFTISRAEERV